jgi:hypothetical protein
MQRYETMDIEFRRRDFAIPRTATVEFAPSDPRRENIARGRRERPQAHELERPGPEPLYADERRKLLGAVPMVTLIRAFWPGSVRRASLAPHITLTQHTTRQSQRPTRMSKHTGYGGFPMPHEIIGSIFHKLFPKLQGKLKRSVTYPATTTITSQHGSTTNADGAKVVPYITFDAIVGRNSTFHLLTNEQLEELGGVEYRALNALLFIVAGVRLPPVTCSLN